MTSLQSRLSILTAIPLALFVLLVLNETNAESLWPLRG